MHEYSFWAKLVFFFNCFFFLNLAPMTSIEVCAAQATEPKQNLAVSYTTHRNTPIYEIHPRGRNNLQYTDQQSLHETVWRSPICEVKQLWKQKVSILTQLVPLYYAICRAEFISLIENFSLGIVSASRTVIFKVGAILWETAAICRGSCQILRSLSRQKTDEALEERQELGSAGCRSANTDASPAPAPLTGRGLPPDPSKMKRWKILLLFCSAHLHVHPLQKVLLTLLSINWPHPSPALAVPCPTRLQHRPNSPTPGAALWCPTGGERRIYATDFNGIFLSRASTERGNWAGWAKRAAWPANKNLSWGSRKIEFVTHWQQAHCYNIKPIIKKKNRNASTEMNTSRRF